MPHKFKFYKDEEDKWRWHKEGGGNIVADSGQGYTNLSDAFSPVTDDLEEGDILEMPPEKVEAMEDFLVQWRISNVKVVEATE